jgi:D-alanyl-lipoteichoic acid acyltransferase DltB (MBOAT superfamily)
VYIPLGGSRGGRWLTYRNIMITMALGGLWHGAGWTFVAWGLFHGVGLVVGAIRRGQRTEAGQASDESSTAPVLQRIATFHLVCLGWVFFRADSIGTAFSLLARMLTAFGPAPLVTPAVVGAIALMLAVQYVPREAPSRIIDGFSQLRPVAQGAALAVVLFAITTLGPQGVAPFIYFRF